MMQIVDYISNLRHWVTAAYSKNEGPLVHGLKRSKKNFKKFKTYADVNIRMSRPRAIKA
jgi:hypothetical protein